MKSKKKYYSMQEYNKQITITMPSIVYRIPDIWLFLLINGITILFSIAIVVFLEKRFPAADRYKENQAIGYISSTICVIFAVLAGFAALFVLTNFNKAGEVAQVEANMALAIYQDAGWLTDPTKTHFRKVVKQYYNSVIEHEWPLLGSGGDIDMTSDVLINTLMSDLHKLSKDPNNPPFVLQEMTKEATALRAAHAERIRLAQSALGPDIWSVILLTAFATIAINFAYGMQYHLHLLLVSAAAIVVSSMLFLIIVLDHPFQGTYSIRPVAFHYNVDLISKKESVPLE